MFVRFGHDEVTVGLLVRHHLSILVARGWGWGGVKIDMGVCLLLREMGFRPTVSFS
jgi:hypothetical protein